MAMQTDEVIQSMEASDIVPGEKMTTVDLVDTNDIDVEIVDDRPAEDRVEPRNEDAATDENFDKDLTEEEQASVGPRVSKRIGRLRYEYHEERRSKEAAERMQQEAIRYAQQVQSENERLLSVVSRGEEVMFSEVRSRTKSDIAAAEQAYQSAVEDGDSGRILLAQKALNLAQIEQHQVEMYQPVAGQQQQQQQQQRQQQQPSFNPNQEVYQPAGTPVPVMPNQGQPNPNFQDPKLQQWLGDNDWFSTDAGMHNVAKNIHRELTEIHGVNPMTDEYYTRLDSRLRADQPEFFRNRDAQSAGTKPGAGANGTGEPAASLAPSVVATTKSRSGSPLSGNRQRRTVQLTPTQKSLAENLGLTPEQYAREVLKMEQKNG